MTLTNLISNGKDDNKYKKLIRIEISPNVDIIYNEVFHIYSTQQVFT